MVKLPNEVKAVLEKAIGKACVTIATSSKTGIPNAVPIIFVKLYDDEHLLVADNFFQKTRKNLEENPHVSVTFWDPETRDGYQVKGSAKIFTSGKEYEDVVMWVKSKMPKLKTKAGVLIKVEEVYTVKPGPEAGKRLI
ncbi:MAG: pyridoxamine 5'-phosphate oxidase family protein [Candidatus Bathyarchaeota archaeon]